MIKVNVNVIKMHIFTTFYIRYYIWILDYSIKLECKFIFILADYISYYEFCLHILEDVWRQ